ncbi:hypothetical protein PR048_021584 [Dryococelus australis]|uniref:Uncharacterized protein n=1 Tax=Dryococelus australis TaxID=614101 RepID=A0ABQ9GYT3_9NEOP|nr:hypothetical protein PR048_021584 [Dryococelus australis]
MAAALATGTSTVTGTGEGLCPVPTPTASQPEGAVEVTPEACSGRPSVLNFSVRRYPEGCWGINHTSRWWRFHHTWVPGFISSGIRHQGTRVLPPLLFLFGFELPIGNCHSRWGEVEAIAAGGYHIPCGRHECGLGQREVSPRRVARHCPSLHSILSYIWPDGLAEIKCFPKIVDKSLLEMTVDQKTAICLELKKDQGQINIAKKRFCDFVRIEREEKFWEEKMLALLSRFYLNCMLPEIDYGRLPRKPTYILSDVPGGPALQQDTKSGSVKTIFRLGEFDLGGTPG